MLPTRLFGVLSTAASNRVFLRPGSEPRSAKPPRHDTTRTLSRELLYTAVTRARSGVHRCAGEAVLRAALSRHAGRVSGLAHRLNTPAMETSR